MIDVVLLVGGIALVGMAGFILGATVPRIRIKKKKYKAKWEPTISAGNNTGTEKLITIYIRKEDKKKEYLWVTIGKTELTAENYQVEYARLLDMAQERAEFLNLEQNTYNYND